MFYNFNKYMRLFTLCRSSSKLLIALSGVFFFFCSVSFCDVPKLSISTVAIVTDSMDCGGNATSGYTSGTRYLIGTIGEPGGITKLSGGNYTMHGGFLGQDMIAPSNVSSIWRLPGGRARTISLQWAAPGDDERDYANISGSRIHIATTTSLTDAETPGYFESRRDYADIQISTSNVAAGSICTYTITGLIPNTSYYMRIWTLDQAANWSDLSIGGTTYAEPVILSVYVLDISTFDFGWQQTDISTVSASGLIVRNDGNTNETFLLRVSSGISWPSNTVWEPGPEPGPNVFSLYSVFNATRPQAENFGSLAGDDLLTLEDTQSSGVNHSMGYQSAENIPPYISAGLLSDNTSWFLLKTPLSTSTTSPQTISIIYSATEAP